MCSNKMHAHIGLDAVPSMTIFICRSVLTKVMSTCPLLILDLMSGIPRLFKLSVSLYKKNHIYLSRHVTKQFNAFFFQLATGFFNPRK